MDKFLTECGLSEAIETFSGKFFFENNFAIFSRRVANQNIFRSFEIARITHIDSVSNNLIYYKYDSIQ